MRPDGNAVRVGRANRPAEDAGIACMEPRGDARRRHRRKEGLIVADDVCAVGLADVGIEIDAHQPQACH